MRILHGCLLHLGHTAICGLPSCYFIEVDISPVSNGRVVTKCGVSGSIFSAERSRAMREKMPCKVSNARGNSFASNDVNDAASISRYRPVITSPTYRCGQPLFRVCLRFDKTGNWLDRSKTCATPYQNPFASYRLEACV